MNDRELLELAAKAAGIGPIIGFDDHLTAIIGPLKWTRQWAPLADDGDALRLAVKLLIEIYHADDGEFAAYASYPNERGYAYAIEPHNGDPCAATRRAIVRAAAEIGRTMP